MEKVKLFAWVDSASTATGFGTVARYVLSYLYQTGKYHIDQLAINYPNKFNRVNSIPWTQMPAKLDPNEPYGKALFLQSIAENDYDIVWVVNDTYVTFDIVPELERILTHKRNNRRKVPKIVYYYPVDSAIHETCSSLIKFADKPVAYYKFGFDKTLEVVPEVRSKLEVIPHGVDISTYRPLDAKEILELKYKYLGINAGKFMFLGVNRNSDRKQLSRTILAFSEFKKQVPNSILMLHTMPIDQSMGKSIDLFVCAKELGLSLTDDLLFPKYYKPSAGFPAHVLNEIYNIADCFITNTLGEGCGLCLHPTTMIDTLRGSIPIKHILPGDEVLGGDGLFHNVKYITKRNVRQVYKIKTMYSSEIKVTKEHPFYVLRDGATNPEWINIEKMRLGDYIAIPKLKENTELPDYMDLLDYIEDNIEYDDTYIWYKMGYSPKSNGLSIADIMKRYNVSKRVAEDARKVCLNTSLSSRGLPGSLSYSIAKKILDENIDVNNNQLKIKRFLKVDDELLYFIGWYLSEGSNKGNTAIEIDLHLKEIGFAERLALYLSDICSTKPVVEINGDNKCRLRMSGSIFSKILGKICGIHAKNKKIPTIFLRSPKSLGPLLKSLFLGDGSLDYENRNYTLTTTSPSLAYQVRYICSANNILTSTLSYPPSKIGKHKQYQCSISTPCLDKWQDFTGDTLCLRSIERKSAVHFKEDDDYFYVKILKISTELVDDQPMYDICVDNIHSFTANGLLAHNTNLEAMAAGTPAIIPDNTVHPEIFGSAGERGYMYPCTEKIYIDNSSYRPMGTLDDILNQMFRVYRSGSKFVNPKVVAARRWIEQYSWDTVGQMWIDLFDRLLTQRSSEVQEINLNDDCVVGGELI